MVARGWPASRWVVVQSWDVVARDLIGSGTWWRVHSAFAHAFNLLNSNGALLGVVTAPAGNGPATIVLAPHLALPPLTDLLQPGQPVRVDGALPIVGDRLILDLSDAALWSPAPPVRSTSAAEVLARLRRAVKVGCREAPPGGLARLIPEALIWTEESPAPQPLPPRTGEGETEPACSPSPAHGGGGWGVGDAWGFEARARQELRRLLLAIRRQDWLAAREPARSLSGFGPGLTPSGDDALAGLALGYRAACGALPGPLADILLAAVNGRTTDLAVARVQHAVAGRPDEAAHRLLMSLVGGSGEGLEAAVRDLLRYGHSSGSDTLVGLIVGLALGLDAPDPRSPT